MGKEIKVFGSQGQFFVDSESGKVVRDENGIPSNSVVYGEGDRADEILAADLREFQKFLRDNGTPELPAEIDILDVNLLARRNGETSTLPYDTNHRLRNWALVTPEEIAKFRESIRIANTPPEEIDRAVEWLQSTSDNHNEGDLIQEGLLRLMDHPDATPLQILRSAQTLTTDFDPDARMTAAIGIAFSRVSEHPESTEEEIKVAKASLFALNLPGGEPLRHSALPAPSADAEISRLRSRNETLAREAAHRTAAMIAGADRTISIPAPPHYASGPCHFELHGTGENAFASLVVRSHDGGVFAVEPVPANSDTMAFLKRRAALMRAVEAVKEFSKLEESDMLSEWDNGHNQLDHRGALKAAMALAGEQLDGSRYNHAVMWFVERPRLLANTGLAEGEDIVPRRAECMYHFLTTAPDELVEKLGLKYGPAEAEISENASRIGESIIEGGVKPESGWTRDRKNPFARFSTDGTSVKVAFTTRSGEQYAYEGDPAIILPVLVEICPDLRHGSQIHHKINRDDYAIVTDLKKACALQGGMKV